MKDPKKKQPARGALSNPDNRFLKETAGDLYTDWYLEESPGHIPVQVVHDVSKSILSPNNSDDLPFDYSVNPYRGCEHGCVYCYARPTHEYLGYSAGIDFETKILVKEDAPVLLEKELRKKSYIPGLINFSGNTDSYQPLERKYKLTRECLKVCAAFKNPVLIITKSALILRDTDILSPLAGQDLLRVSVSVTTLNETLHRQMEPRATTPETRLRTIRALSQAGIPVSVIVGPVVPGLNDKEIPAILNKIAEAGASSAYYIMLRLPHGLKDLMFEWIQQHYPEKENKIRNTIMGIRGGALNDSRPGVRFKGEGEFAKVFSDFFKMAAAKAGLKTGLGLPRKDLFTIPQINNPSAPSLFDDLPL